MHHHTLVQIACRTLNLIRPVSDTHPLCENSIDLGSTDKARFYNFETDNAIRDDKVQWVIDFGKSLMAIQPTPRTWLEWQTAFDKMSSVVGPADSTGYRIKWVIRKYLIHRMRSAGVSHLLIEDATVRNFAMCFPDQKAKLWTAAGGVKRGGSKPVREVMQESGYHGAPELWTMYACLFSDAAVSRLNIEWLRSNMCQLRHALLIFVNRNGFAPHPATLLQADMQGVEGEVSEMDDESSRET